MFEVIHEERSVQMVPVRLTAEGQKRREQLLSDRKCLGCERSIEGIETTRGLCNGCYQAMRRAVKRGKATEQLLLKQGRLLGIAKPGRRLSNPLAKHLNETA
jgi:hypothetical protein